MKTKMKKIELLPCPFCGGKGAVKKCTGGYWATCYNSDALVVKDNVEHCKITVGTNIYENEEKAIEVWNTRWKSS